MWLAAFSLSYSFFPLYRDLPVPTDGRGAEGKGTKEDDSKQTLGLLLYCTLSSVLRTVKMYLPFDRFNDVHNIYVLFVELPYTTKLQNKMF